MLQACLAVRNCISFTAWGFGDADSWVPGFFTGEGYATLYDVNLNPKAGVHDAAAGSQSGCPRRTAQAFVVAPRAATRSSRGG